MEDEILQQEQERDMPVEAPVSVPDDTSPETNTMAQGTEESPVTEAPVEPMDFSGYDPIQLSLGQEPEVYELDFGQVEGFSPVERDPAVKRSATATSLLILRDEGYSNPRTEAEQAELEMAAQRRVKEKRVQAKKAEAEQRILSAQSQDEVLGVVRSVAEEEAKPVLLSEMNYEALVNEYQPTEDVYLTAEQEIQNNMRLAQVAQKAADNVWDQTGWFGITLDALEAFSPTYVVSERMDKTSVAESGVWGFVTVGGAYEDLAERLYSLPTEKRQEVVDAIITEIVEQETVLFRNGNSLLQADQLSLLSDTLRDGFAAYASDGGPTSSEAIEYGFGLFDAVLGVGTWGRTGRSFLKGMVRKVLPKGDERAYAGARQNSGSYADAKVAANPIQARADAQTVGPAAKLVEDGLPDFAAAQRFMPVSGAADDVLVEAVEYRGKLVPLEFIQRVSKDLESISDVADDVVLSEVRKAASSAPRMSPKSDVFNPSGYSLRMKSGEPLTSGDIVKQFDDAVDNAIKASDDVDPQVGWSAYDSARIETSIRDIGQAMLTNTSDFRVLEMDTAKSIERMSGGTLKHNPSMTVWKENDDLDSLGNFKMYLGDGDTGFASKQMAQTIGKQALGEGLKPVQINGKWYLEKQFTHKYNPDKEAGFFETSRISALNPLAAWFLNPMRKLGIANLKDVWANVEVNRATAQAILEPARKSLKRLNDFQLERVGKILAKGDEQQKVYTKQELVDEGFGPVSDKEYEAYQAVRRVFDSHYLIINNETRKAMVRDGWKSLSTQTPDEAFFGRIINREEARKLGTADEPVQVWDETTQSAKILEEVGEDLVLMRSHTRKVDEDGSAYTLVAGRVDDVTELPMTVVNKRVGHVPRMYADRKFKIVEETTAVVNGVTIPVRRARAIARTEAEAEELRQALIAEGRFTEANLSKPIRTVENPADDVADFLEDINSIGYVSSNIRSRGEQLLGTGLNPARVADPLEAAAASMLRVERELNRDVVRTLEQKFLNTWREYLTDINGNPLSAFPREGQLKFKADTPDSVVKQVRNAHGYIVSMDSIQKGKFAEYFGSALAAIENSLFKTTGLRLGKGLQKVVDGDAQRAFMKLATNAFIIGRPLFQVPTNLLQTVNIMVRYPMHGPKAAARALGVASALASRNSKDFEKVWKAFGKTGYSDEHLKQLLDLIDDTGIVKTTGQVDDFLGLADAGLRLRGAESKLGRAAGSVGRAVALPVRGALHVSSKAQEASINFGNLVAIITEFDRAITAGTKMTAKTKSDILSRARMLTQVQNSLDKFGYQEGHNPLQMMFQFAQHVNKLFLDIAVEPYVKAIFNRGIVKGNESVFSETRGVAIRTALLTMSLFGMNGLPIGSDLGGKATNYLREMYIETYGKDLPDELWNVVQGGLINMLVNTSIEGNVDVTARISPSAFMDFLVDMFGSGLSLDVLGAAGGITESVMDIGYAVKTLATTPELDTVDKGYAILREASTFFAGMKDAQRARIAMTWLQHPYMGTLSGPMRVTHEEAILSAFSVNSKMIEDLYRGMDFGPSADRTQVEEVSRVMIRAMNDELTTLKKAGELDYFTTMDVSRKWVEAAKAHIDPYLYDDVYKEFEFYMLRSDGEGYKNFIRSFTEGQTLENQIRTLKRLREEVQFEDYREFIDQRIWDMEQINNG